MTAKTQQISFNPAALKEGEFKIAPDVSSIPDIDLLLQSLSELVDDLSSSKIINMRKKNKQTMDIVIAQKYNTRLPIKMINLLCDAMDDKVKFNIVLNNCLDLIDNLEAIKTGKTGVDDGMRQFSEKMNEQYIYPKFGGKEACLKKMEEQRATEEHSQQETEQPSPTSDEQ